MFFFSGTEYEVNGINPCCMLPFFGLWLPFLYYHQLFFATFLLTVNYDRGLKALPCCSSVFAAAHRFYFIFLSVSIALIHFWFPQMTLVLFHLMTAKNIDSQAEIHLLSMITHHKAIVQLWFPTTTRYFVRNRDGLWRTLDMYFGSSNACNKDVRAFQMKRNMKCWGIPHCQMLPPPLRSWWFSRIF